MASRIFIEQGARGENNALVGEIWGYFTRDNKGEWGKKYEVSTSGGLKVKIFVSKLGEYRFPTSQLEDCERREIEEILQKRQVVYRPRTSEADHRLVIETLRENWRNLVAIFYPLKVSGNFNLVCFSEVSLRGLRIDLLGVGPDGRFLILEIGKKGKEFQLERYRNLLEEELGIPKDLIMGFKVYYKPVRKNLSLSVEKVYG
jgi:hypothetical protein